MQTENITETETKGCKKKKKKTDIKTGRMK